MNYSIGKMTSLMRAAAIGHARGVRVLIDQGEDVNEKGPRDSTALMFAAGGGHLDVVKELLRNDADVTAREASGWSARTLAEIDGHHVIAELLREVETEYRQ